MMTEGGIARSLNHAINQKARTAWACLSAPFPALARLRRAQRTRAVASLLVCRGGPILGVCRPPSA